MITITITMKGDDRMSEAKAIKFLLETQFGIEEAEYGDTYSGDDSTYSMKAHNAAGDRRDIEEEMEFDY